MKEVIFNRKDYKSYKDFYHDLCVKLNKDRFIDWRGEYENLGFNADLLNEFLWYCHDDNLHIKMLNFDTEKISKKKTYEDYKWNLIIEVLNYFALTYSNNKLEYINEKDEK